MIVSGPEAAYDALRKVEGERALHASIQDIFVRHAMIDK
jgi:hypothetical protein